MALSLPGLQVAVIVGPAGNAPPGNFRYQDDLRTQVPFAQQTDLLTGIAFLHHTIDKIVVFFSARRWTFWR